MDTYDGSYQLLCDCVVFGVALVRGNFEFGVFGSADVDNSHNLLFTLSTAQVDIPRDVRYHYRDHGIVADIGVYWKNIDTLTANFPGIVSP